MSGNKISTYADNAKLRKTVMVVCIFCAIIMFSKHTDIFHSYYDRYMVREVFRHQGDQAVVGDDLGLFWKHMSYFMLLSYLFSAIVLVFDIPFAVKKRIEGAVSDLIIYSYLALSIPVGFLVCMIGSRSYVVDLKSFTFVFEVIAFVFFAGAFVIHLKTFINIRGDFEKGNYAILLPLICILFIAVPVSYLARSIKLSVDYAPNYGKFRVDSEEYDPGVEDLFFNYYNNAVEADGALYICRRNGIRSDDPYSVDKLGADGSYTHIADIDHVYRFDVYKGKIYYLVTTEECPNLSFEIISMDIDSKETEVIYSDVVAGAVTDPDTWWMGFNMFKIKDGILYYHAFGNADVYPVYCIDLDAENITSELYVSDILTENFDPTYAYLYHYCYSIRNGGSYNCGAKIIRGDFRYYVSDDGDYDEDGRWFNTVTLRKVTYDDHGFAVLYDLYSSDQNNGLSYYDNHFYFYENDTQEIVCCELSTESVSSIATVDGADPDSYYTMYIYGDHILLVDGDDYIVVDR